MDRWRPSVFSWDGRTDSVPPRPPAAKPRPGRPQPRCGWLAPDPVTISDPDLSGTAPRSPRRRVRPRADLVQAVVAACLLLLVLAPAARGSQEGTASDPLQDLEARVQAELERATSVPSRVELLRGKGEPAPFVGLEAEADRLELEALEERAERARDDLDAARAVVQGLVVDEQRRATRLAALPELIARGVEATQAEEPRPARRSTSSRRPRERRVRRARPRTCSARNARRSRPSASW